MIQKILIANRGEIALRIIRTCKRLNIITVAVYSDADKDSLFVQNADESYSLNGTSVADTYLNIDKIIEIVNVSGADAVHPGYGFLSENAEFATRISDSGAIFIGPSSDAILAMGMKSTAKKIMQEANVPVVPGYNDDDNSIAKLREEAEKIGYPLLIKAAAGGGGKGMRIVRNSEALLDSIEAAKRESLKSFANDKLILEKYLESPRHIEVQVLFDNFGNGIYLYERDCSIQRRYQKIIEEAPAPNIDNQTRKKLGEAALQAASTLNYTGVGTVEFLFDEANKNFYFMEMNTRLQVEHPVTEMITGIDLVEMQIDVANNLKLKHKQEDVKINGHAIEARVYAEDTSNNFLPSCGFVNYVEYPESKNIRIDNGIKSGDSVSVHYDPMLAKIIAHGNSRQEATKALVMELENTYIIGIKNNIRFLLSCLKTTSFLNANITTNFIAENILGYETTEYTTPESVIIAAAIYNLLYTKYAEGDSKDPWAQKDSFRLNSNNKFTLTVFEDVEGHGNHEIIIGCHVLKKNNNVYDLGIELNNNFFICNKVNLSSSQLEFDLSIKNAQFNGMQSYKVRVFSFNNTLYIFLDGVMHKFNLNGMHQQAEVAHNKGTLNAPMHGTIVTVNVNEGEEVVQGDVLVVLEAMKMEHTVTAPASGVIKSLNYKPGEQVSEGSLLLTME